ncbi:hypothetical protein AcV7_004793 [Taiwanofungus camphoratus]|nr:hypothetical protein AcV7_004793 [Antrodia cinnamomea]
MRTGDDSDMLAYLYEDGVRPHPPVKSQELPDIESSRYEWPRVSFEHILVTQVVRPPTSPEARSSSPFKWDSGLRAHRLSRPGKFRRPHQLECVSRACLNHAGSLSRKAPQNPDTVQTRS